MIEALRKVIKRQHYPLKVTYIKVRACWKYLYRAVDREGATMDFLLTARRNEAAVRRFLQRALNRHGEPEKITIDKNGANTAAINNYNDEQKASIEMRQCKYLNNIVEWDHRAIKRMTRLMLSFKSFRRARILLAGIETMHMIQSASLAMKQLRPPQSNSTRWRIEL